MNGLLAVGVPVNHQNAYGDSALHYAAANGSDEIILALLRWIRGIIIAADLLVRHRASVNIENKYGQTPLHHAAQMGHADACVHLIHWGADTEKRSGKGEDL